MNRDAFLTRVRLAARAGQRYRVHVDPIPLGAGYVGCNADPCQALASEIKLVGGHPQVVPDWSAAREAVSQLLRQYQARSVLSWEHPVLDRLELTELLAQHGLADLRHQQLAALPEQERRAAMLAADIGISSASYAIAETGTVAVFARAGQERVISLVPPVHIAVVAADQVLPDLFDLFGELAQLKPEELPSNVALISGPSKTGDVELELTTGVHGPGHWHVVIVNKAEP